MKKTLVITRNLDFASLWSGEENWGNYTAVLLACPLEPGVAKLWEVRYPNIPLLKTPEEALAWSPSCVVVDEPGYWAIASMFKDTCAIVGSSVFLDQLGLDPEISRNALRALLPSQNSRRFIALHSNPLMVQSEAIYYSLRYPDDTYILDIQDSGAQLCVSAKEILSDIERFTNISQQYGGFFAQRTEGLLASSPASPQVVFAITFLHGGAMVGRPIISWDNGVNKIANFLPPGKLPEIVEPMKKLMGAWKLRGALTLHCILDSEGNIQAYKLMVGMPSWTWAWLRANIGPTQSWGNLWRSIGKGAQFNYLEGGLPPSWVLVLEANSSLQVRGDQLIGTARTFLHDTLLGNQEWDYCHFCTDTLEYLEQICRSGLFQKKPLWASIEQFRIEQYLQSWADAPIPEDPPEESPEEEIFDSEGAGGEEAPTPEVLGEEIKSKEELASVC